MAKRNKDKKLSNRMQLRKGSGMHKDLVTQIVLFCITITFFILVIFIKNSKICLDYQNVIENISLGIAASAFISFVTIFVPYIRTKNKNRTDFSRELMNIYMQYQLLYAHSQTDRNIRIYVNEFKDEFQKFKLLYESLDFTSESIDYEAKVIIEEWELLSLEIISYISIIDNMFDQKQYDYVTGISMTKKVNKILSECIAMYEQPLIMFPKEYSIRDGLKVLCKNNDTPDPYKNYEKINGRLLEKRKELEDMFV